METWDKCNQPTAVFFKSGFGQFLPTYSGSILNFKQSTICIQFQRPICSSTLKLVQLIYLLFYLQNINKLLTMHINSLAY